SPRTATLMPRQTVRAGGDRFPRGRVAGDPWAASPRCGVAAMTVAGAEAGPAGRRGSYSVLLLDPIVCVVVRVRVRGIVGVGAVQVGAVGLAAEPVPEPPSGPRHPHRGGRERDREQH